MTPLQLAEMLDCTNASPYGGFPAGSLRIATITKRPPDITLIELVFQPGTDWRQPFLLFDCERNSLHCIEGSEHRAIEFPEGPNIWYEIKPAPILARLATCEAVAPDHIVAAPGPHQIDGECVAVFTDPELIAAVAALADQP